MIDRAGRPQDDLASLPYRIWNSAAGKLFFFGIVLTYAIVESGLGRNDLDIFLAASSDLFLGKNIYTETYFDGYHFFYSTFFATMIRPLAELPEWLSKFIWLLLNVCMILRSMQLLLSYFTADWLTKELRAMLGFLVFLFCLRFIRGNLHLGQITGWMLWLSLEALSQIRAGKKGTGAFLLALAINIKLLPLVFIPYLLYRAEFRATIFTMGFIMILFFVPGLWLGWDHHVFLLKEYFSLINPAQTRHILDVEETSFHSLTTLLATLLSGEAHEHNGLLIRRNIAFFSAEQLQYAILAARLMIAAGTLWFLRSKPFRGFQGNIPTIFELSYLLLAIPLIFPHQQHYAFLLALPAVCCVTFTALNPDLPGKSRSIIRTGLLIVVVVFNLSLWLGQFNAYYNHFKVLTYAALILVVLLMATFRLNKMTPSAK